MKLTEELRVHDLTHHTQGNVLNFKYHVPKFPARLFYREDVGGITGSNAAMHGGIEVTFAPVFYTVTVWPQFNILWQRLIIANENGRFILN